MDAGGALFHVEVAWPPQGACKIGQCAPFLRALEPCLRYPVVTDPRLAGQDSGARESRDWGPCPHRPERRALRLPPGKAACWEGFLLPSSQRTSQMKHALSLACGGPPA